MGNIRSVEINNDVTECTADYRNEDNVCEIDSPIAFPYTAKIRISHSSFTVTFTEMRTSIKYDEPQDWNGGLTWKPQTFDMVKLFTNEDGLDIYEAEITFDEPGYYYIQYSRGPESEWSFFTTGLLLKPYEGRDNSLMWWIIGEVIGLIILIILIVVLVIMMNKSKKMRVKTEPLLEPVTI